GAKVASLIAAAVAYRLAPDWRVTEPVVYPASCVATLADTTLLPPAMMIRAGWSRFTPVLMTSGMELVPTSSTGPPRRPAAAAASRASGKFRPVAMYAMFAPGSKVAAMIAADVAYRSAPNKRVTLPVV